MLTDWTQRAIQTSVCATPKTRLHLLHNSSQDTGVFCACVREDVVKKTQQPPQGQWDSVAPHMVDEDMTQESPAQDPSLRSFFSTT